MKPVALVAAMAAVILLPALVTSSEFKIHQYKCSEPLCHEIVSVSQNGHSGYLYVTTKKTLKELNEDLTPRLERTTVSEHEVQNIFTVLRGDELLTCKNDENGTCELRDVETLDFILPNVIQPGLVYPGMDFHSIIGWIPSGEDQLITAISTGGMHEGAQPLPLVSTRSFPTGRNLSTGGFLELLSNEFNVPSSSFHAPSCLTDEMKPFYGFSAGSHNFILKRQTNGMAGTTIKLIRICKGSTNVRSYMELPIQCNGSQEVAGESGVEVVSSAAYFTNDILFMSITKRGGSEIHSYVCRYNISTINDQFTERRRECLQGETETTELTWHQYNYCPQKPPSQFNFSLLNNPDYCYNEPYAQPLGGNKPIEATAMRKFQYVITAMLVVMPSSEREEPEYLLGDKGGNLHRISGSRVDIEMVDDGHGILEGSGLLLGRNGKDVFALSNRTIVKLSLEKPWITESPKTTPPPTTPPPTTPHSTTNGGDKTRAIVLYGIGPAGVLILVVAATAVVYGCA